MKLATLNPAHLEDTRAAGIPFAIVLLCHFYDCGPYGITDHFTQIEIIMNRRSTQRHPNTSINAALVFAGWMQTTKALFYKMHLFPVIESV